METQALRPSWQSGRGPSLRSLAFCQDALFDLQSEEVGFWVCLFGQLLIADVFFCHFRFYCDYCDTYLTHDSPSVRKTHCSGLKHKANVKDYYQKWMEEQAQSLTDKKQQLHFNKERSLRLGSLFLCLQGP